MCNEVGGGEEHFQGLGASSLASLVDAWELGAYVDPALGVGLEDERVDLVSEFGRKAEEWRLCRSGPVVQSE